MKFSYGAFMKFILGLLIIALNTSLASAQTYTCVLSGNETHTSKFPCDAAHIDRFSFRLNELSSEVREMNAGREAVESCISLPLMRVKSDHCQ